MSKFAPVAPIQVLEGLYAHSPETFGNYHLLLAHHTVEHAARFRDLFQRASDDGHHCEVIMDNSIVELGTAVNFDMIAQAVTTVQAPGHEVFPVLPDVMGKGEETRLAVSEVYKAWEAGMPGQGYVAVCQGKDWEDYTESVRLFTDTDKFPAISVYSIPRILVKTLGSRVRAAAFMRQHLALNGDDHNLSRIHFLGFSDNITDDIDSVHIIEGAGIDSAVPLRIREMFTQWVITEGRAPDWFDTAQVDKLMVDNLLSARQIFGG